jgi:hypothetical protein
MEEVKNGVEITKRKVGTIVESIAAAAGLFA